MNSTMNTEQIQRIARMEQALDTSAAAVTALADALECYRAALPELNQLTEYYDSPLWRQDYEDDEAGKLPSGFKRGVLSEDAVYNLLNDNRQLQEDIRYFINNIEHGGTV